MSSMYNVIEQDWGWLGRCLRLFFLCPAGWSTYHSMELAASVALGQTTGIFAFAGAELTEVLGGFGDDVCE